MYSDPGVYVVIVPDPSSELVDVVVVELVVTAGFVVVVVVADV
jgi:F420-0:gamma-glutamyl ligase-like protein